MTARFYTAVIMTMHGAGTPHAGALQRANPGLDVRAHYGPAAVGDEKIQAWRNCDRHVREWWRAHREAVTTPEVLFFEWDVYCNADLNTILAPSAPGVGMSGAGIARAVADRAWPPFADVPRMPRSMRAHAVGIVPFAAFLAPRAALDDLISPVWDEVYASDVFCEVRTPTVMRKCGWRIGVIDGFKNVGIKPLLPRQITKPGVWHPVKKAIS